jgi:hypothetical protein
LHLVLSLKIKNGLCLRPRLSIQSYIHKINSRAEAKRNRVSNPRAYMRFRKHAVDKHTRIIRSVRLLTSYRHRIRKSVRPSDRRQRHAAISDHHLCTLGCLTRNSAPASCHRTHSRDVLRQHQKSSRTLAILQKSATDDNRWHVAATHSLLILNLAVHDKLHCDYNWDQINLNFDGEATFIFGINLKL